MQRKFTLLYINSKNGFTLTELMVVVAIIGILASVAVPQYSKFIAKVRTAEVKAALSVAYTAETTFIADHDSYTTCLSSIGYTPAASNRYYAIGFHDIDTSYMSCNTLSCSSFCNNAVGDGANRFDATVSAGILPPASNPQLNDLPTTLSDSMFVICAAGAIQTGGAPAYGSGYDSWCITNTKSVSHTEVGY